MGKLVTIPAFYLNTMIFRENVQKNLNVSKGGFTPATSTPQNEIIHEQVLHHHRSQRTVLGTGTVPSSIVPMCFLFHILKKEFFRATLPCFFNGKFFLIKYDKKMRIAKNIILVFRFFHAHVFEFS